MTNTDPSGNMSPAVPFSLTIDTFAPVAPTIASIGGDLIGPFFTTDSTPTITGIGEINTLITLTDGSGAVIGTGMTDGSGNYTIPLTTSLADGTYDLDATSTDIVGNVSTITMSAFVVDTIAPIVPTITSPIDNTLASDTTPILIGTGEPNTVFIIRDASGSVVASGSIDTTGSYSYTFVPLLTDRNYPYSIASMDAVGNISSVRSLPIIIDTLSPSIPSLSAPVN
jgi:hypothetical protein